MKLSPRLTAISQIFIDQKDQNKHYDLFVDTCCDHGLLGFHLANKISESKILLVDIVPNIINLIQQKIKMNETKNIQSMVMDARELILPSNQTILLFIAGVGGELAAEIIEKILLNNPESSLDFVIAPNNKSYLVRDKLKSMDYKSLREELVFDRKHGYEIIFSSKKNGIPFDRIGKKIFNLKNENHINYLDEMRRHYFLKSTHSSLYQEIYSEYKYL